VNTKYKIIIEQSLIIASPDAWRKVGSLAWVLAILVPELTE